MDAVESFCLWPVVTVLAYVRFSLGCCIVLPVAILRLLTRGSRSLVKFVDIFDFLQPYPLGRYVFSGIVGYFTPYTASIYPLVTHFSATECTAQIYNYPWLRNPFHSVHAVALMNLGEFVSGVCMMAQMQSNPRYRGIPLKMETEYYKKARGTLTAKGTASLAVIL